MTKILPRSALLMIWASAVWAAAPINPYPVPTIYPNYPADSTFKSMIPSVAPKPVPNPPAKVVLPITTPSAPSRLDPPPIAGSVYGAGAMSGVLSAPRSGGSEFYSDQPPIVDPSSVPTELVFEPRKRGSPSPRSSP